MARVDIKVVLLGQQSVGTTFALPISPEAAREPAVPVYLGVDPLRSLQANLACWIAT